MSFRRSKTNSIRRVILAGILRDSIRQDAMEDFEDQFEYISSSRGNLAASIWYWYQIFSLIPGFILNLSYWSNNMFQNYLKIAFRNLFRHKLNSILNITGLAIGLACTLLIFIHIKHELSYEDNFSKADRIYRITNNCRYGDNYRHWALDSPQHIYHIQKYIPEIEKIGRFRYAWTQVLSFRPESGQVKRFKENRGYYADPAVLDIFDFHFITGDPKTALVDLDTLVLTSSMAERYFGNQDPIGRILVLDGSRQSFKVTGVISDIPSNTHLQFDYLISVETYVQALKARGSERILESRTWKSFYSYVLIPDPEMIARIEAKLPEYTVKFYEGDGTREEILNYSQMHLQPIKDIHLHSHLEQEMGPNSNIAYVKIFGIIAVLILLIAGVNFVNISTAQAFKRMKEVGVRKVMGAQKGQLIKQFLGESLILTLLSGLFSLVILLFFFKFYNNLTGQSLPITQVFFFENVVPLLFVVLLLAVLAGLYPALFMANFRPVSAVKNLKNPRSSAALIRKGLVVFQFFISIFMIFCTIIITKQMEFFRNKDMGFNKDSLVAVELYGDMRRTFVRNPDALKTELLQYSGILNVATASDFPGDRLSLENLRPEGWPESESLPLMRYIRVDEDYLQTLNIALEAGRNFKKSAETTPVFIINRAAADALGLENPVGKSVTGSQQSDPGRIIGVTNNFHFASLHNDIEPMVLSYRPSWAGYLLIKIRHDKVSETLQFMRKKMQEMAPANLFMYTFIDDEFNRLYQNEDKLGAIFKAFSLIAILVSCLGLFGLSAYSAELHIKEIGVRKVLGASVSGITFLLTREFIFWVGIANIFALPAAYFVSRQWLQGFAFRTNIGIEVFFVSAMLALIIALISVSYRTIKAALTDPVESLRYE